VVSLLASCGGQTTVPTIAAPTPPRANTPVSTDGATISFGAWEYEMALYEPLAERFNAENPGITVVVVPIDEAYNNGGGDALRTLRAVVSLVDTASTYGVPPAAYNTPLLLDLRP
jgi:ABC-type glycerol-3-phosphate transport system substrate-binding protein